MKKLLVVPILLLSLTLGATNYYVKTGGNDGLAGTSDATAWATLTKVQSSTFSAGDSILFRRGDTFRGSLYRNNEDGTPTNWIYWGAYGTGAKPKILGAKDISATGDWTNHSGNIWKTTATLGTVQDDISNLIFNNEAFCGYKKKYIDSLNAQGKFFYNPADNILYLYSASNPGTFYTHIEAAGHHDLRQGLCYWISCDYIHIADLDVRYSSGAGIETHTGNVFIIERCDVSWIGGEWLLSDLGDLRRLGNGISLIQSNDSITVRNCHAHQCFDAGISPQYWSASMSMTNMWMYNNVVTNCWYSYETWAGTGITLSNVHFYNNTCIGAGDCWSGTILQRPDPDGASHILIHTLVGTVSDLTVRNNILINSTHFGYKVNNNVSKLTADYNVILCDTVAYLNETNKYTTLAAWVSAATQDAHSIDDDPLFVSTTDFNLQSTSPAKDTGVQLGLTTDYAGTTRGYLPDIGAYEIEDIKLPTLNGAVIIIGGKLQTIRK